jgi:uncharacterized protein (DUF2384 family)
LTQMHIVLKERSNKWVINKTTTSFGSRGLTCSFWYFRERMTEVNKQEYIERVISRRRIWNNANNIFEKQDSWKKEDMKERYDKTVIIDNSYIPYLEKWG